MTKCGKCDKTVYPMETLNYLDKVYHKACFRCTECNMTLNIKTAKGYNKIPYCQTHYPKDKATPTTDSIDLERTRKATQEQSKVKYLENYEKQKGMVHIAPSAK